MLGRLKRRIPADHPAFAGLPVTMVTLGRGAERAAVHVSGRFSPERTPLVCLAGYHRNMSDYGELMRALSRFQRGDWPVVLVDLLGRGRSDDRRSKAEYGSPRDAHDLCDIAAALCIERAVFLGQGYGGQVVMALAAQRPTLIAGAILIDAGPVTDSRGIVRLRNNLDYIAGLRGARQVEAGYRRMLAVDYPGLGEARLAGLIQHCHWFDRSGRARPLFDPYLVKALQAFGLEDVLVAQWPLYEALRPIPLMLMRTQLTDQLRRETFEEMVRRRPDAIALTVAGQGSPLLFDEPEEVDAVTQFLLALSSRKAA